MRLLAGLHLPLVFSSFSRPLHFMIGDMPAHDWHHFAGLLGMSGFAWPIAIYERQRAIDEGDKLNWPILNYGDWTLC